MMMAFGIPINTAKVISCFQSSFAPQHVSSVQVKTHHQQSNHGRTVGVFNPSNTDNCIYLHPQNRYPRREEIVVDRQLGVWPYKSQMKGQNKGTKKNKENMREAEKEGL
jgi:hypothetical protein